MPFQLRTVSLYFCQALVHVNIVLSCNLNLPSDDNADGVETHSDRTRKHCSNLSGLEMQIWPLPANSQWLEEFQQPVTPVIPTEILCAKAPDVIAVTKMIRV